MTSKKFSFDIDQDAIKSLAELLKEADLSEIEYEDQGRRVRLTRSTAVGAVVHAAPAVAAPAAQQSTAATSSSTSAASEAGAVKSPMVGTLYLSPEPGAPTFVSAGSKVNKGDTVCIVEAMKVMNPIKAHMSGTVREVRFEDASPVEFGDTLLIIE